MMWSSRINGTVRLEGAKVCLEVRYLDPIPAGAVVDGLLFSASEARELSRAFRKLSRRARRWSR